MTEQVKTTVVIVTYNSAPVITAALQSIPDGVPVVIVDNNSSDETRSLISARFPYVLLKNSGANLGFARAVNLAAMSVETELILLLNPDAVLAGGAVEALESEMLKDPNLGVLAPVVLEGDGSLTTAAAGYEPSMWRMFTHSFGLSRIAGRVRALRGHYLLRRQINATRPTEVSWVSGGCLMTRRSTFRQLGGITERWFMYAEDVDYGLRAHDAGWGVQVVPTATATHQVGASSAHVSDVRTEWLQNLHDLYRLRFGAGKIRSRIWLAIVGVGFSARASVSRIRRDAGAERRFEAYFTAAMRLFRDAQEPQQVRSEGAGRSRGARYYPVARTAHLERLSKMQPAVFYYTRTRQDWDLGSTPSNTEVVRVHYLQLLRKVIFDSFEYLEIPEPLALTLLPQMTLLAALTKVRNVFRPRTRLKLVFYAIENFNQVEKLRTRFRLPRAFLRTAINLPLQIVLSETTRVAFGTEGSLETYREQLGVYKWKSLRAETREFPALASAEEIGGTKEPAKICFLGSFEERKGILRLMAAWPMVEREVPDATLTIMGHGPLAREVVDFSRRHTSVIFIENPSRSRIRSELETAHVLVLLSQPTPVWREQIGLPILEGLSSGCEIVTTFETGIASWLVENGHAVVDHSAADEVIAAAITGAATSTRTSEAVRAALPIQDGRIQADRWLFTGEAP